MEPTASGSHEFTALWLCAGELGKVNNTASMLSLLRKKFQGLEDFFQSLEKRFRKKGEL
jgi:hypothetical protein